MGQADTKFTKYQHLVCLYKCYTQSIEMTNKIKVFVGFLALIALFSVYSVFNSLSGKSGPIAVVGIENPLPNPEVDIDHDGLTNREESYWNTDFQNPDTDGDSFLDGEEVVSRHNPLIPGPNDALVNTKNLTEKSSALLMAGLVEGSLKFSSPKFDKSVDSIVDDLFYQSDINHEKTTLTDIVNGHIITIGSDKASVQEYLKNINSVLTSFWADDLKGFINVLNIFQELDKSQDYKNPQFKNAIDHEIVKFENQINQLRAIQVPSNWINIHSQLVAEMQSVAKNYLLFRSMDADPMQGIISYVALSIEFTDKLPALLNYYVLEK